VTPSRRLLRRQVPPVYAKFASPIGSKFHGVDIMPRDQMHIQRIGIAFVAWYILAIVSVGFADAATIKEVARCRAIAKRSEMVACFKALKEGRPAKTEGAVPADPEGAASTKKDETAPAKAENAAPANAEGAAPTKKDETAPAKAEDAAPANADDAAPTKKDETAPTKTAPSTSTAVTTPAKPPPGDKATPNVVPPSTSDEPLTTSSINRPRATSGRPLCVDRDALAGMLVAGLLTSDPALAATRGCQTLPSDAKLQIVQRYPAVFSFIRMIAVKVTSPTRPDLTIGFTIEVDPLVNEGSLLKAPQ
jgi:hypothetical protein